MDCCVHFVINYLGIHYPSIEIIEKSFSGKVFFPLGRKALSDQTIDSSHVLVTLIDNSCAWRPSLIFQSLFLSASIFHNSRMIMVRLQHEEFIVHPKNVYMFFVCFQRWYMFVVLSKYSYSIDVSTLQWLWHWLEIYKNEYKNLKYKNRWLS